MEAVEKIKEVFLMYAKNHVFFGDDVIEGIERLKIGNNIRDLILSYAGVFGRFLFGDKNFIKEYGELLSEFNVFINNYAIRYKSKLNEFSVIIINEKFEKDYLPHEEYIFDCGNIFVYNSNETIVIDGKGYGHIYGNNCEEKLNTIICSDRLKTISWYGVLGSGFGGSFISPRTSYQIKNLGGTYEN